MWMQSSALHSAAFSLTDGVVGAYVQFDLNQTLSQFLHWHEISASQIHTLAVRNSSGEGATLWKNDEGQNLERHLRKSKKNFPCCVTRVVCFLSLSPSFACFFSGLLKLPMLSQCFLFLYRRQRNVPFTHTSAPFSQLPPWPPLSLNGVW